jgi:hypothetical protein
MAADGVEGTVLERKRLRISDFKCDRQLPSCCAPTGRLDHRRAQIDPAHMPLGTDPCPQVKDVGIHSAADVQDPFRPTQVQAVEDDRFGGNDRGYLVTLIEEPSEERRVAAAINRREAGHVLVRHGAPLRCYLPVTGRTG